MQHFTELRLISLHHGLLSLVHHHVLLCLVHLHFVQEALGQQLLQVVPDEHGHVLRGAEGEQQQGQSWLGGQKGHQYLRQLQPGWAGGMLRGSW